MKGDKLHNTSFEQQLRQAADRLEMQPSDELWQRIQQKLPRERKPVLWWRWAAAAAVLLLAGLGWYLLSPTASEAPQLVHNEPATHQPAAPVATPVPSADLEHARPQDSTVSVAASSLTASKAPSGPPSISTQVPDQPAGLQTQPVRSSEKNGLARSEPINKTPFRPYAAKEQLPKTAGRKLPVLQGATPMEMPSAVTGNTPGLQYSAAITHMLLEETGRQALLAQNASGQKDRAKVSVGLFFTPGMSYRTLKTGTPPATQMSSAPVQNFTNGQTGSQEMVMRVNAREKPMQQKQGWGWGSGVRLAVHLRENWILQTGLSLRQTNYEVTAYQQDPAYVTSNGAVADLPAPVANSSYTRYAAGYGQAQQPTTLENRYLSTELPLLVGKRFGNPEVFSFTVLAGAGLTYLLQSNSVMYAPASQRYFYDKSYLSPFNSSLILEASMHIPLSENLGFSIGPALQYQMFSSYKHYSAVKEYPYLIGVKTAFLLK